MGEDSGHYARCAVHSYRTCVRLEGAYVQIASVCGWRLPALGKLSGVRTEDDRHGGFLHVTKPFPHHCLTHRRIAFSDGASCWFHSRRNSRWVCVIDHVRINSSTAHTYSLTPQRSIWLNVNLSAYVEILALRDTLGKHVTKILICFTISAAPCVMYSRCLTLCRFYLKPYCMGRNIVFFFSGHLNLRTTPETGLSSRKKNITIKLRKTEC